MQSILSKDLHSSILTAIPIFISSKVQVVENGGNYTGHVTLLNESGSMEAVEDSVDSIGGFRHKIISGGQRTAM